MFMWLAGNQKPDFMTLNDFLRKLLKGVMEEVRGKEQQKS